jgi:hypothetical protein
LLAVHEPVVSLARLPLVVTRSDAPVKRQRGSIPRRARCYEVRVSAGDDPSTGERPVLVESVDIEGQVEKAERAAYREAEKVRTRLLPDADPLKVAWAAPTVALPGRSSSAASPAASLLAQHVPTGGEYTGVRQDRALTPGPGRAVAGGGRLAAVTGEPPP